MILQPHVKLLLTHCRLRNLLWVGVYMDLVRKYSLSLRPVQTTQDLQNSQTNSQTNPKQNFLCDWSGDVTTTKMKELVNFDNTHGLQWDTG